jgi:hypothetical protein
VPSARHSVPSTVPITPQIPSNPTATPATIESRQAANEPALIFAITA